MITENELSPGAVFISKKQGWDNVCLLPYGWSFPNEEKLWQLSGLSDNALTLYSSGGFNSKFEHMSNEGSTTEEILRMLNYCGYVYWGKLHLKMPEVG